MKAFDAEASETTAYFRSVNATRNEVLEYSDALKQHITDIGIDIIDVDYDTKTHVWLSMIIGITDASVHV